MKPHRFNGLVFICILLLVGLLAVSFRFGVIFCISLSFVIAIQTVRLAVASNIPKVWIALILSIKILYAFDLVFSIFDGRPLRYTSDEIEQATLLRSEVLLMLMMWMSCFVATVSFLSDRFKINSESIRGNINTGPSSGFWSIVLIFFSQVAFFSIVYKVGGVAKMLMGASSRYEVYFGIGFLRIIVAIGIISAAFFLIKGKKRVAWFLTTILFVELATLGGRSFALLSTFIPMIMVWTSISKRLPLKMLIAFGVGSIAFVSGMGAFRAMQLENKYQEASGVLVGLAMDTGAADNFPSLYSMLLSKNAKFEGFSIVQSSIFSPIPRAIWPSKPMTDEAALVATVLTNVDSVNWGLPIGPHGLSYYTFGIAGIFIFSILSGIFAVYFMRKSSSGGVWLAVSPSILIMSPDLFSPAYFGRIFVFIVLAVFLSYFTRIRLKI